MKQILMGSLTSYNWWLKDKGAEGFNYPLF